MTQRLGLGVVALAWLLPAMSWWQLAPSRNFLDALLETPLFLYTAGGLALVGAWLTTRDRWLGVFVLYAAASAVAAQTYLALAIAHWIALGAIGLEAVRGLPAVWRARGAVALLALGVAQSVYGALQFAHYDPLWWGWDIPPYYAVHGTVGNPKFYGALLAMLTPLAPWWLLPVFAFGIVISQSFLAALAATLGVLVRPGLAWRWRALGVLGGAVTVASVLALRGPSTDTTYARLNIWALAFREWLASDVTWFGFGQGAWYERVPSLQVMHRIGLPEIFLQAHNEVLQLLFERGVLAVAILVAWVVAHRAQLVRSPYRGAALALAIESLGLFPFRVASVAVTCVVILALVTVEPSA